MKNNVLVFIIDDDLIHNEVHELIFKKSFPEINVRTFTNCKDALKAIDQLDIPDIIFLDMVMPEEQETVFLDEHKRRRLAADIYLMSSTPYLTDQSLITNYPAVKDFVAKPLLENKIRPLINHFA